MDVPKYLQPFLEKLAVANMSSPRMGPTGQTLAPKRVVRPPLNQMPQGKNLRALAAKTPIGRRVSATKAGANSTTVMAKQPKSRKLIQPPKLGSVLRKEAAPGYPAVGLPAEARPGDGDPNYTYKPDRVHGHNNIYMNPRNYKSSLAINNKHPIRATLDKMGREASRVSTAVSKGVGELATAGAHGIQNAVYGKPWMDSLRRSDRGLRRRTARRSFAKMEKTRVADARNPWSFGAMSRRANAGLAFGLGIAGTPGAMGKVIGGGRRVARAAGQFRRAGAGAVDVVKKTPGTLQSLAGGGVRQMPTPVNASVGRGAPPRTPTPSVRKPAGSKWASQSSALGNRIRAGKFSPNQVRDLQAKGLARKPEQMASGIERGNQAIMRKRGGTIAEKKYRGRDGGPQAQPEGPDFSKGGRVYPQGADSPLARKNWTSDTDAATLNKTFESDRKARHAAGERGQFPWGHKGGTNTTAGQANAIVRRHEVDELRFGGRGKKGKQLQTTNKEQFASHVSPRVIMEEAGHANYMPNQAAPWAEVRKPEMVALSRPGMPMTYRTLWRKPGSKGANNVSKAAKKSNARFWNARDANAGAPRKPPTRFPRISGKVNPPPQPLKSAR